MRERCEGSQPTPELPDQLPPDKENLDSDAASQAAAVTTYVILVHSKASTGFGISESESQTRHDIDASELS